MDNFHLEITADDEKSLFSAIEICLREHTSISSWSIRKLSEDKKEGFKMHKYVDSVDGDPYIFFYWSYDRRKHLPDKISPTPLEDIHPFPYPVKTPENLIPIIKEFLHNSSPGEKLPDFDGDCDKGWTIYSWVDVCSQEYMSFAVKPTYALFGK